MYVIEQTRLATVNNEKLFISYVCQAGVLDMVEPENGLIDDAVMGRIVMKYKSTKGKPPFNDSGYSPELLARVLWEELNADVPKNVIVVGVKVRSADPAYSRQAVYINPVIEHDISVNAGSIGLYSGYLKLMG